ncbi:MAG: hypothetical protein WAZ19_09065 [Anaerolineae bacterium]
MGIIPFNDHKDSGGIQPFYKTPDASAVINEFEFRLSPPIAYGTSAIAGDPEFLISYDPTENQAYWQAQVGGVWQEGQPVDGVRRGDGPPSTPTVTDRLYVDMLNGDLYVAWDDSGTKQWLLVTATAQLWQSLTGITSLVSQPNAIRIDEATGNIGLGGAPLAGYDLAMKGIRIIDDDPLGQVANERLRTSGNTKSNQEYFGYAGLSPNARYIVIDTKLTAAVPFASVTIDFTVHMGGQFVRKIKGTLWCVINSGVPIQVQGSLTGFDAPTEIRAGVNSLTGTACIVIDNVIPWEASFLELSVTTNNNVLEAAGVPVRFAVSSVAALPAWATLSATIRNAFLAVTGTTATFTGPVTASSFIVASAPQFVSATTTLSATATSVIFSNAANATLTIPSALTVVGQMLYVGIWGSATASKFIVPSAGQIQVTPAGVTAASVTITTAVVYQAASDGNWYIVG